MFRLRSPIVLKINLLILLELGTLIKIIFHMTDLKPFMNISKSLPSVKIQELLNLTLLQSVVTLPSTKTLRSFNLITHNIKAFLEDIASQLIIILPLFFPNVGMGKIVTITKR